MSLTEQLLEAEQPTADARSKALWNAMLDASIAVSLADERYRRAVTPEEQEHAAIAAEVARVRHTLAHALLDAHAQAVHTSELDEKGHHPSFTEAERRWFYAQLGSLCKRTGMDRKSAESLAATAYGTHIRPSAMHARYVRAAFLRWLAEPEGIKAYADAEEARLSAMVRELVPVKCEQCGKQSHPTACKSCGWRHKQEAA